MKIFSCTVAWARLGGLFFRELMFSVKDVAIAVLLPQRRLRSAIVAVELELTNDCAVTLLANLITLTPGTTSLHVSSDRRVLYVHVMNVSEDTVQQIKDGFERRVREVLP